MLDLYMWRITTSIVQLQTNNSLALLDSMVRHGFLIKIAGISLEKGKVN